MKVAIHQPVFLPYLGTLAKTDYADVHVFLDDVGLNVRNFTRRCHIRETLKGVSRQLITVPLNHSRSKLIKDTQIDLTDSNKDWLDKTLKTFDMVYGKAPYYKELRDSTLQHFFESEFLTCLDNNFSRWTISCYITTCHLLSVNARFLLSSEICAVHGITSTGNQRLIDICKALNADEYISGEGGRSYMDIDEWKKANINVVVAEYVHIPFAFANDQPCSFIDPYSIVGKERTTEMIKKCCRLTLP